LLSIIVNIILDKPIDIDKRWSLSICNLLESFELVLFDTNLRELLP